MAPCERRMFVVAETIALIRTYRANITNYGQNASNQSACKNYNKTD